MTAREDLIATVLRNILLALLYWLTGKLSFAFFQQDMIVTVTVFIPEGIALAAVLIYGYRVVPGIFLGQMLLALDSGLALTPALGIALTNALEAAIAYRLFAHFRLDKTLSHIRDLIGLFLMITLVLQPFSALLGNIILLSLHLAKESEFLHNLFFWWFGNVVGQLLIAPMLLILYYNRQKTELYEYALVALLFTLLNYVLQVVLGVHNTSLLLIATLPFTIYLATVNLSYATLAAFTLVITSLYFFHFGKGTFVMETNSVDQLININFFILSHTILVLIVGILFREKEEAITSLRSMAHYDPLTGLPNRHLLRDEIHHSVYLSEQFNQESMVCFLDLDGFKKINDNYGHKIGDKLLKKVAQHIKCTIRSTDTLLRLGGDEFLLILNNADKEKTESLLERIMESVRNIDYIDNHRVEISLSIGVASCPMDGVTVENLMHASDHAMYQAKKEGKDKIVFTSNCFKDLLIKKESPSEK